MDKIIKVLTERVGIAVVVLGALVFIVGAAGSVTVQSSGIQVVDLGGRIALGVLGLLVLASGLLLIRQELSNPINRWSRARHKIRIEYPADKHIEHGDFVEIGGSYRRKPPDKSLRLFVVAEDQVRYWPKCVVTQFDEDNREWSAHISLIKNDPGKRYGNYIVAALVGQASAVFWDYYFRVGESKGVWEHFNPLPPDVIECDRVYITKQS
jgi:hypothetical protein